MKFTYLKMNKWIIFYLIHSIYINFKYLPFRQAIKLPIFVYRPKFLELNGKIKIESPIKTGMIQLGFYRVPLYSDSGCLFQINGDVIFKGKAKIGNDSKLIVGNGATLTFGDNFNATAAFKVVCYNNIIFEKNALIGWDNLFMDYDFHELTYVNQMGGKGYGSIIIKQDTWFCNGCRTYKNVSIPKYSVISANSILSNISMDKECTIIGNRMDTGIKKENVYHDYENDKIKI